MKLIRRLLIAFVALILLLVGGIFLLLEPAVVAIVEKGGTHALGVETRLASADIGILSGHFGLTGLSIDNPPGFEAAHFLELGETGLDIEMGSLTSDRVVIPRVLISDVTLVLERNAQGSNYDVLLENLKSLSGPQDDGTGTGEDESGTEDDEGDSTPGPDLVIGEIILRNIRAEVNMIVIGGERRTIPLQLPEITIRNVGGEDGAQVDVVYSRLVEELLTAVVAAGGDQLPAEFLADLEGGLKDLGNEQLQQQKDELHDQLEQKLGAEDAHSVEEAAKGLKGLFDKD